MSRLLVISVFIAALGGFFFLFAAISTIINFFQIPLAAVPYLEYSIVLFVIAFILGASDLLIVHSRHQHPPLKYAPIKNPKVSVAMTAYNDEAIIGKAVNDFKKLKEVISIIVIDNNCTDNTAGEARKAGATVVEEKVQGYGAACIRGLKEARKKGNVICLVEGDLTYSAADLKKLLDYLENADMVVGTRTTAELIAPDTQVSNFLRYFNVLGAKLIQLRFWEKLRLTDMGCTFRVIRPEALDKIIDKLYVTGNHFSPHMMIEALKAELKVIEIPITFHKRGGVSKGVGTNMKKVILTAIDMLNLILFT